jgi:hypothetical protein
MIWLEILVIIIIISFIAWLFGVDGAQILAFYISVIMLAVFLITIGYVIGIGIKLAL